MIKDISQYISNEENVKSKKADCHLDYNLKDCLKVSTKIKRAYTSQAINCFLLSFNLKASSLVGGLHTSSSGVFFCFVLFHLGIQFLIFILLWYVDNFYSFSFIMKLGKVPELRTFLQWG